MLAASRTETGAPYVALTGNPNCGKTTIFNALTGLRAKVGNYGGVTVERKEGRLKGTSAQAPIMVLDLPGTYSLSPKSLDEEVSCEVLFHELPDVPAPRAVVIVVDASNLQRNLYYTTQVIELGYPTILALNMVDVAEDNGHHVDGAALSRALGVPVIPLVASKNQGVAELRQAIQNLTQNPPPPREGPGFVELPEAYQAEIRKLTPLFESAPFAERVQAEAAALLLLADDRGGPGLKHQSAEVRSAVGVAREALTAAGIDWRSTPIEARYARVARICQETVKEPATAQETWSDRVDRVVTHKVWGMVIFLALMAGMFQCIFTFAKLPMALLTEVMDHLGGTVETLMPPGALNDLLVNGVIAGVGAVVVFLPQILLLFLFISLLEDSGYMARAAFIMDHLMGKVGLHGKSFIPLLSSFACAIPGIMSARTVESPKDRLVTILIAPLMSCSARLPVYSVLIAACIPDRTVLGVFKLAGLTLLGMYLLGITVALCMAWLFKKTLLKASAPLLIMELPPYKRPVGRVILRHIWERSKIFLTQAGTVILGINIILWFLATYPRSEAVEREYDGKRAAAVAAAFPALSKPEAVAAKVDELEKQFAKTPPAENEPLAALHKQWHRLSQEERSARLQHSLAGHLGRLIEPIIAPLGFDWKIGIGIISSFAAREVFVSTMSIVYNAGEHAGEGAPVVTSLATVMQHQTRPDGTPLYTALTGITLMMFYVLALQCASTVAIVRRETNSWKWPVFQWLYMGALAWTFAFVTYQVGRWLGW